MRSSHELVLAAAIAALCACANDQDNRTEELPPPPDPDTCETSYLRYDNFGEPFALDWCRGCHSSAVPAGMRQKAPMGVNFDTQADVAHWRERILIRAAGPEPSMPPAGGPADEERALLAEWLGCGAR
jgi:hypothetical protein